MLRAAGFMTTGRERRRAHPEGSGAGAKSPTPMRPSACRAGGQAVALSFPR